mgnify:CR=1 FL=1|tara:strand:- start:577 stop:1092 length:516 start_codon:yes stop_codon:yes gene_type:complete
MTRQPLDIAVFSHHEHPGLLALRLHKAALPPVPDTYEDLNARRCAAQTTRYGTVLDRHGRPTGWLYSATVGERPYFVRGTVTTGKRRSGSSGWCETATWHVTGPRVYQLQVGDRIKFRVIALWRDRPTAWRIIKSLNPITVRLGGYSNYIVRPDEVLESREIDKPDAVQVS